MQNLTSNRNTGPLAADGPGRYAGVMPRPELAHLELLADVNALVDRLNRWCDDAPAWQPAEKCRALVRRLTDRAASLRVRIEAPLVVATLGGTGTGKSALVNAIVGAEVVQTGRSRPTTTRPTLVCRPGLTPEMLGIDPATVELCECDLPALRDLVLVDCPDPDTTEDEPHRSHPSHLSPLSPLPSPLFPLGDNLARLRAILPHCDVLLVTATQQKYRSARVADELAAAARGAHLVFVQTHADLDADVRDDWRHALERELPPSNLPSPDQPSVGARRGAGDEGVTGPTSQALTLSRRESGPESRIFRIDSLRALADAQAGLQPRGEFADLLDLLTRQMAGAAGNRIRRANFLDLVADTLDSCRTRIDEAMPAIEQLQSAIDQQRAVLVKHLAGDIQTELLASRRQWENRLLAQITSRWGFSPFALVLRVYQGIGGLLTGALLYRARTPAQVALWGAFEGMRDLAPTPARPSRPTGRRSGGSRRLGPRRTAQGRAHRGGLHRRGRAQQPCNTIGYTCRRGPVGRRRVCRPRLGRPGIAGLSTRPASHPLVHPLALRNPAGRDARTAALSVGEEFLL